MPSRLRQTDSSSGCTRRPARSRQPCSTRRCLRGWGTSTRMRVCFQLASTRAGPRQASQRPRWSALLGRSDWRSVGRSPAADRLSVTIGTPSAELGPPAKTTPSMAARGCLASGAEGCSKAPNSTVEQPFGVPVAKTYPQAPRVLGRGQRVPLEPTVLGDNGVSAQQVSDHVSRVVCSGSVKGPSRRFFFLPSNEPCLGVDIATTSRRSLAATERCTVRSSEDSFQLHVNWSQGLPPAATLNELL